MRSTLTILSLLALACSSSTGGDASNIPLDKMPAELSKVLCEKIYMCCSAAERMNNPFIGTDQNSCQNGLGALLSFVVPEIQASVSAGRAAYHGDRMGNCVSQLRATSCADAKMSEVSLKPVAECAAAFEAKVQRGGNCTDHGECVDGYCEGAVDPMPGKCAAKKADGQACADDEECTGGACTMDKCGKPVPGTGGLCN
jgi:hypothetical protein